jgi:uncharacterized phage infection (PIP) family protein YhgE
MKRIIAFVVCAIILGCTLGITTFAEEPIEAVVQETTEEVEPTITEQIVDYVKTHYEELSVIVTLLLTVFYNARKHGVLNKTIGTLNNNAVKVAENSGGAIKDALEAVEGFSKKIDEFLEKVKETTEDKEKLASAFAKFEDFLVQAKLANIELADEVAELLVLANIPNAKKEELYARHLAAVKAIDEKSGVIHNDSNEA